MASIGAISMTGVNDPGVHQKPITGEARQNVISPAVVKSSTPVFLYRFQMSARNPVAKNVYGQPLVPCSFDPLTGFFRDGCCKTCDEDVGNHTVCAVMDATFLIFSEASGNDLTTPRPELGFPGLKPGDQWCLCASRWVEAWRAGMAPNVVLESTNQEVLEMISLDDLRRHAHVTAED